MRSLLIRSAIILLAAVIAWILGARQFSLFVDRLITVPLYSLPVSPLAYSPDTLWISDLPLSLSPKGREVDVHLSCDSGNRVRLTTAGRRFTPGRCMSGLPNGSAELQLTSDPGDEISLDVNRSIVSWPTPFEMNFMTGQSTTWRRDLYYRLKWKKASGAQLVMVWRFEQGFYPGNGWTAGTMTRAGSTGLIEATVIDGFGTPPETK